MKIVLVHNQYQQGGGEDVVFAQERRNLERAGHEVVAYRRSNWEIDDPSLLGRLALARDTVWSSRSRRDFAQLLDREVPDIVHVHNTFVVISPSIYSACQDRGVPVVQTLHNFRLMCPTATFYRDGRICEACADRGLWSAVRHGCYRGSRTASATVALMLAAHRLLGTWRDSIDSYITLTAFSRKKFIAAGFSPTKIFVKPNFIDPDPGHRALAGDYAVFTGRLSPEKGLMTLLRAWERLPVRCPLQIIGDGPEWPRLEAFARERNIRGVTFRGRLAREETLAAVKGARFVIVPSVYYEGFPMVIVEAMACGVPILGSRLGAMEEIVADGVTGLHFGPGDADDLMRKVEWAWQHPSEMHEMGRAARREYENHYTADRNYSLLMQIYERTLNRAIGSVPALSN
jgi:glycosyltransferase involved in cell wall biosynthesis